MGFLSNLFGATNASKLMLAARAGDAAAVRTIVSSNVVQRMHASHRATLFNLGLFEAAAEGHLGIVRMLVNAEAALDRPHAAGGETALIIAAFRGHDEIVELLVSAGANVNISDKRGATPLMFAAAKCSPRTVECLLRAGADPKARTHAGTAAADFAEMEERSENEKLLRPLVGPSAKERLQRFAAGGEKGDIAEWRPFEPTGNMPDMTRSEPVRAYRAGRYLILFLRDLPAVADRAGANPIGLRFIYTMIAIEAERRQPALFVTLERTMYTKNAFCTFDATGAHSNLGTDESLAREEEFIRRAMALLKKELALPAVVRVK